MNGGGYNMFWLGVFQDTLQVPLLHVRYFTLGIDPMKIKSGYAKRGGEENQ